MGLLHVQLFGFISKVGKFCNRQCRKVKLEKSTNPYLRYASRSPVKQIPIKFRFSIGRFVSTLMDEAHNCWNYGENGAI